MTASLGYLDAALRRMALPICVNAWFVDAGPDPIIVIGNNSETQSFNGGYVVAESFSPAEATAAYLALCRELDPTAS